MSKHIEVLGKAIRVDEPQGKQVRKEEEEWLAEIAKEMYGALINSSDGAAIDQAITKLKSEHPNLEIQKLEGDAKYLAEIKFSVSKSRQLYIKFPKATTDTEIGIL